MIRCSKCGYHNQANVKTCSRCRNNLQDAGTGKSSLDTQGVEPVSINNWGDDLKDRNKTVLRPIHASKSCALVPLSPANEELSKSIALKGDNINLNREFLDEGNTSISRKSHANLVLRDGSWFINNSSELKTTFVQVNTPMKLSDGDVILIGDSLFKFKSNT